MARDVGRGVETSARRARLPAVHRRLEQARPPLERVGNEYVETPLRPPPPPKPDGNFALVTLPITTQPTKAPDIVCSQCHRCRCDSCRTPKQTPATNLCQNACFCWPTPVLDCITCMCVPRALSYHCSDDEEGGTPSWACLALSTVVFPCILCYLPCKGVLRLCDACNRLYNTPGCRCGDASKLYQTPPPPSLEKRLLDSPDSP